MARSQSIFNISKPQTASQWIILLAVTGVLLTSPYGGKVISQAIRAYLEKRTRAKEIQQKFDSKNISKALYNLRRRKIVQIKREGDKARIILTEKGRIRKLSYDIEKMTIPKPKNWDKNWRFLIFDIPEDKRNIRNEFRAGLKRLGFIQFQQSVWIFPYPCEEEVDFLAEFLKVNRYLSLLTVKVKKDAPLRERFKKFNLS